MFRGHAGPAYPWNMRSNHRWRPTLTETDEARDFALRMASHADRIIVRVICTHRGKGFDGDPIVIVAFLDNGWVIPDYRYWREDISEVGGRLEAVAQARGGVPTTVRSGTPRMRELMKCACGTGFPFASSDVRSLVSATAAAGQHFLELSTMPGLIHALRDTP